ncbi:FecR family protein [Pseudanabaena mucicola]|uniref:FecR domain-containing protein n=1 Tax=Pseudanabaena mucicola FACHB-723 TaxID=2692860 RepID=A0ABR7ZUD6_9CYAN|nr:FecR family protein [Pseudanabaena mucicola]MBD2187417.1 FecR domain-containing protein [Pseudanabaena mucicola FACHB-723]
MSGNVIYRNLYNYANRPARVGDRLQVASDEISTGANSAVVLQVDTGIGLIYIEENTTIRLLSLKIAPDNGRIVNLSVPRGKARLQVRRFTNRGSQLNIQTPSGISGVRGTSYIVQSDPSGNTVLTTLSGSVATSAQNRTEIVNGGQQNRMVVGDPPSPPMPIDNDVSLRYTIERRVSGIERSIIFVGYTSRFNFVSVNGVEQSLDRDGRFMSKLPVTSNLKARVIVRTTTGITRSYEVPIL